MSKAKDAFNKQGLTRPFDEFVTTFNTTAGSTAITSVSDDNMKAVDGRTLYMDSNIAITDGSKMVTDADAQAIPSVYHALVGLKEGLNALNTTIGSKPNPEWEEIAAGKGAPGTITNAITQLIEHTKNITDGDSKISSVEAYMHASMEPEEGDDAV